MKNKEGKRRIAELYIEEEVDIRTFAENHKLAKSTVGDYVKKYVKLVSEGVDDFHDKGGRPPLLDEQGVAELKANVGTKKNQKGMNKRTFRLAVTSASTSTNARRGKGPQKKPPSRQTIRRVKKAANLGEGKGQVKTSARIVAEGDPRNAYSMVCMASAFCQQLRPEMICNWDATQFVIQSDGDNTLLYVKDEDDEAPLTMQGSGELGFAIKLYHLHNAYGNPGPAVLVIADDGLKEDDVKIYRVPGLGNTAAVGDVGHVCFTKTRCGNTEFYRWYAKEIVAPFIKTCRETNNCKVSKLHVICLLLLLITILPSESR
jgi:hypothetical protein